MNILVLGGSGFIGRAVCEQLVRLGHRVTVPTRRAVNARSVQALPLVTVVQADVHSPKALASILAGHDAVVNLIAILQGKAAAFEQAHVALPKSLGAACKTASISRLIHVSALGVSEQAPSLYLRSKWQGEAALRAIGLAELLIVRPSIVFGAGDRFTNLFAKLQSLAPFMPLAGADARMQPVWVADVAEFIVKSAICPSIHSLCGYKNSSVFEAVGPDILTLRQIVALSGEKAGCLRPIFALPPSLANIQALLMELAPGEPLMSRDNLASLRVPNVASGQHPTIRDAGIEPASLAAIAPTYLGLRGPRTVLNHYRKG